MAEQRDVIIAGIALAPGDDAALALARELARCTGARLELVHVHPFEPLIAVPPPAWEREQRARATAALDALAAPLRAELDVGVQTRPNPSPVRALHEVAEELGARLLVVGGTHRRGIASVVPGGVPERLLHASPCAVAIAPPDHAPATQGLRRIGVAFAGGPEGAEALALAVELARGGGGRVRTVTVAERALPAPGATGGTPPPDMSALLHDRAERIAAKARAAIPGDLLEAAEVRKGRAADELQRASGELDLLICGSRGYGPVRSLLLGGVTWTLAHTVACPLLVVPRAAAALSSASGDRGPA